MAIFDQFWPYIDTVKALEKRLACKAVRATFLRMRAVTVVAGPARLAGARMKVRVPAAKQVSVM